MEDLIRLLCVTALLITIPITVSEGKCTKEQFQCKDGICVSLVLVCDSTFDCPSNEDEINCTATNCPEGLIRCNGKCRYDCKTNTGPPKVDVKSFNKLYLLFLLFIIPIVLAIVLIVKYK